MTIFLFPTELEAARFRELCPTAKVVISGVGLVETSSTILRLVAEHRLDADAMLVLCGIAGAYDDRVHIGEVVEVVEERCVELPERFQCVYSVAAQTDLRAVRSNCVHRSGAESAVAELENMEGAALFALCSVTGIRCAQIRAVSNRVGDDFANWNIALALDNLTKYLKHTFDE